MMHIAILVRISIILMIAIKWTNNNDDDDDDYDNNNYNKKIKLIKHNGSITKIVITTTISTAITTQSPPILI